MMAKYKKLFYELHPNTKNILLLKKSKSDINIHEFKMMNAIEHENIYEELYIIINYLKENKDIIKNQKDKETIIRNYFDIIEKDGYLRDKDVNYQKYILNFGNNDNIISIRKQIDKSMHSPNLLSNRKRNGSCLNLNNYQNEKKKLLEYNLSFYHPGTYYLFNKGSEEEYHAWSCCMNDKKTSKGCCKKIEKIQIFNYDIIV